MSITIPANLTYAAVLYTRNFDAAYLFYLLAKKISDEGLSTKIVPGLVCAAEHESIEQTNCTWVVEYCKAAFPSVVFEEVSMVRYDRFLTGDYSSAEAKAKTEKEHEDAGVDQVNSWLSTKPDGTTLAVYSGNCKVLVDSHFDSMEEWAGATFDNIRSGRNRTRLATMPWRSKGTDITLYRPFIEANKTRYEIYKEIKDAGLTGLIDNTIGCTLSRATETNNYTQACGECYLCKEKEWIKLQHA